MILNKSKAPKNFIFPDNFVCNIPIKHIPLNEGHRRDRCYCQRCITTELDPSVYSYDNPISCHPSFPITKDDYLGVYLRTSVSRREQGEENAQVPQSSCQTGID